MLTLDRLARLAQARRILTRAAGRPGVTPELRDQIDAVDAVLTAAERRAHTDPGDPPD